MSYLLHSLSCPHTHSPHGYSTCIELEGSFANSYLTYYREFMLSRTAGGVGSSCLAAAVAAITTSAIPNCRRVRSCWPRASWCAEADSITSIHAAVVPRTQGILTISQRDHQEFTSSARFIEVARCHCYGRGRSNVRIMSCSVLHAKMYFPCPSSSLPVTTSTRNVYGFSFRFFFGNRHFKFANEIVPFGVSGTVRVRSTSSVRSGWKCNYATG